MDQDLKSVLADSDELTISDKNQPVTPDELETDKETEIIWDNYIQALDPEDKEKAYKEVTANLSAFFKFQKRIPAWSNAETVLEKLREEEYTNLTIEEKKHIASSEASANGIDTLEYAKLTDRQKNRIYLSPVYYCKQDLKEDFKVKDPLVYICSYINFPPIKSSLAKYTYFCKETGKFEIADMEQAAHEAILSVLAEWKQKGDQQAARKAFKDAIQNKVKRTFQKMMAEALPSFTGDGRHFAIRKTIEKIEQENHKEYNSDAKEDILNELTKEVNERLQHKKQYTLRMIKFVLKKREFGEVPLEQYADTVNNLRLTGYNYEFIESPEELAIKQIEYETVLNSLSELDQKIVRLSKAGYNSAEIAKLIGKKDANVRQRKKRMKPQFDRLR